MTKEREQSNPGNGDKQQLPEDAGAARESANEPAAETPGEQPAGSPSLEEQLEATRAERDENYNKFLRAQAELDNFRKRTQRDREEERRFANLPIARDILPAMDNLQRAIDAAAKTQNVEELTAGVKMVLKQIEEVLGQYGVKPVVAVGQPFNPNLHEAVQQVPTDEHPPMTVIQELERGYTLHERVVRPSKVIVSAAIPEETSEPAPPSEESDADTGDSSGD